MHDLLTGLVFLGMFISPIIIASRVPIEVEDKEDCDLLRSPERRSCSLLDRDTGTARRHRGA